MESSCGGGFDQRWHEWIEEQVKDHDYKFRGNGEEGIMSRTLTIEKYIATQVEREREKRTDRVQYKLASFAGAAALAGLLIMAVLDHTIWKPVPPNPPVVVQQTTTTDTTSTTTKIPVTK